MNTVVIYSKLAPFHRARLETAGRQWKARGSELACIEIASRQSDYYWSPRDEVNTDFTHLTLFDDRDYLEVSYFEVRSSLQRALDRLKPDVTVVNGWGLKESIAGLAWSGGHHIPRVVLSESQQIDSPRRFWKERLKRFFVRRCHSGFVGGAPHIRYLESLGLPREYCVAGCSVIDNDLFSAPASVRSPGDGKQVMRLLSCVRLIDVKNIPTTLKALSKLRMPWHWTIAGDGPEREEIVRIIAELGLEQWVDLRGSVPYQLVPDLYRAADVYLQPSTSETWGLAVNEAMASSLPVLVSRQCGCHEDLVREGINGYTFEPRSIDDISATLERMWQSRNRWAEMGRESHRIIQFWSLDLFAQNLWRACEMAIGRAKAIGNKKSALAAVWNLI